MILHFTDSSGADWDVFEVHRPTTPAHAVTEGREAGWLSFSHGEERRRLAPVPTGWESLDVAALESLCQLAARVRTGQVKRILDRRQTPRDSTDRRATARLVVEASPEIRALAVQIARIAKRERQTVVAALMALRQVLEVNDIAVDEESFRAARRAFLEAYYFEG